MARLQPLPPDEFAAAVGIPIPEADQTSPQNLVNTLGRHAKLTRRWMPYGMQLMFGLLPARDRELLILRTGLRCGSRYEWGQHVLIARQFGLTDEEITRVASGPEAEGWGDGDRLLLRAADELHDTSTLSQAVWDELAARYDDAQLIEIPLLVGHYHATAYVANALDVEPDAGLPDLP
jgi:alkylhydroperoxidase family enzyme